MDCPHLSIVVAPQPLEVHMLDEDNEYRDGGSIANVFTDCSRLEPPDYITPRTAAAVLAACRLEYWTWKTHRLCQPGRRGWIHFVLLAFDRVELPSIVQLKVLEMLKRHELGPPVVEHHRDDA